MSKWNMIIDVAECTNCNLCTLAAMDEYVGNEWPGVSAPMPRHGHHWIRILQKERGQAPMIDIAYVPITCNHCDDAPCIKAARDDAITKRDDGIVVIKADRFRTQEMNRSDARDRLVELVKAALVAPKPRIKTKPSKSARKKRTDSKVKRGEVKKMRRTAVDFD